MRSIAGSDARRSNGWDDVEMVGSRVDWVGEAARLSPRGVLRRSKGYAWTSLLLEGYWTKT